VSCRPYNRIIVYVENSARREGSVFQKYLRFYHCVCCSIITKRLYFELVVIEENFTSRTLIYLVGVYIKTSASKDVAKSKVITPHCWVVTEVKRLDMLCGIILAYERSGTLIIKYKSPETVVPKRFPAVEALLNIVGDVVEIMPVLN
jgi:hypothetical protein